MGYAFTSRAPLVLATLLVLAGCGKSDDPTPAGGQGASPQASLADAPTLKPGQWLSSIRITRMDIGGDLPPQAKAAIAQSMGAEQTSSTCLTPEEAARPSGGFINRDPSCTYTGFSMAGGRITGTATCKPEGMVQTMTMSGRFGAEDYEVNIDSKTKGPDGVDMNSSMIIKSRRTGPCSGQADG